ncbi:hypothetical protein ACMWQB_30935, partial [Escherichia coli]|uniref:hypothetical protein n=1 Tax=Escherichia coli TaxID=562 RepID=UPI0039DFDD49
MEQRATFAFVAQSRNSSIAASSTHLKQYSTLAGTWSSSLMVRVGKLYRLRVVLMACILIAGA